MSEPFKPPYLECYFQIENWPAIQLRDLGVSIDSKWIYEDHSLKLKTAKSFLIYSGELAETEHHFDIRAELVGENITDKYIQPIYIKEEKFSINRNERVRCDAYIKEKEILFKYTKQDIDKLQK